MEDKNKDIMDRLMTGIKETMNGEHFRQFLKVQAQFHNYSYSNAMLIYKQNPNATRVAGFQTWKKLDRYVIKGQKSIQIIRPEAYKFTKDVPVIDPGTKKQIIDPATNKPLTSPQEFKGLKFVPANVFDISQTDGKPLPEICKLLQGQNINSDMIVRAIRQSANIPIIVGDITSMVGPNAKGYYSRGENEHIGVREGMSLDHTAKTMIHEFGHSKLHRDEPFSNLDPEFKEFEAESVAFIVSDYFGVDTSEYSFDYLANWTSGLDIEQLKPHFKRIQEVSDIIINDVETVMNRELALEYKPVRIVVDQVDNHWLKPGTLLNLDELNSALKTEFLSRSTADYKEPIVCHLEIRFADGTKYPFTYRIDEFETEANFKELESHIQDELKINIEETVKSLSEKTSILELETTSTDTSSTLFNGKAEIKDIVFEFEEIEGSGITFKGDNSPLTHGISPKDFDYLVTKAIEESISPSMTKLAQERDLNPFDEPLPHPFREHDAFTLAFKERTDYIENVLSQSDVIKFSKENSTDFVIFHPSTKDGQFQLTYYVNDEPFSDAQFDKIEDVAYRLVDTGFVNKVDEVIIDNASLFKGDIENQILVPKIDTIVVNAFAGPGAGKTTSALELVAELKKNGLTAEYVPEYAKELVFEEKYDLLNGEIKNENIIYDEKMRRIERLMGKVDVIVTDSSLIQSVSFLDPSKCSPVEISQFAEKALGDFNQMRNFNYFVERGHDYETTGRVHSFEQSREIDIRIKLFLEKNNVPYQSCSHRQLSELPGLITSVVKGNITLPQESLKKSPEALAIRAENEKQFKEYASSPSKAVGRAELEKQFMSPKERVVSTYEAEFKSIKHISNKSAKIIEELNESYGRPLPIKNIRRIYNELGKKIESDPSLLNTLGDKFNKMGELINDLNQTKITEKQMQLQQKARETSLKALEAEFA